MDPVTQGVLGASASQLVSSKREKVAAAILGMASGMAADLDVLIRSSTDPLLFLEYHRHFTHALVFIPFGALICAVFFRFIQNYFVSDSQLSFSRVYLFCLAGYATHALLDACTTYGTQLFWPFSDTRVAWNNVSVVDPLFTVPLLLITLAAIRRRSTPMAWVGMLYAICYLGLGVIQGNRAEQHALQLAYSRGHTPINLGLKPSFANIIVWKSVYEHDGRYYVDAVRVLGNSKIYTGTSTPKLSLADHFPWLDRTSQQAIDVERFRWFSNQHLGLDPDNKNRIIDIRYSLIPNSLSGMWGIELSEIAANTEHVSWATTRPQGREMNKHIATLWRMILGQPLS